MQRLKITGAVVFATLLLLVRGGMAQVDVLEQHNNGARTGANLLETVLTPTNVSAQSFGMLSKYIVDDQVYSQPLVATDIRLRDGWHDLVFVTTVNNSVYAYDANDTKAAKPVWHVNFGTPANLHDADFGCVDMNGNIGIVGTPAIDAAKSALYVVALTKTGSGFEQRLHALDLATGADLPNSPVVIAAPAFDPIMQNQRPALMLASGNVYIGYASHCDKEPYHGFLLSYDAKTLHQKGVLNTSPGGEGASIWQSGQAPALGEDGNLYLSTGNGSWDGNSQFSESFLKLDPSLKLIDWFTPTNHFELDKADNDLDSSGATLIPGSHLVVGGGKEGILYVLDGTKLGHLGDDHALQHFRATGSHLHSIVYWESARQGKLLYIWGQRDQARVYRLDGSKVEEKPVMTRPEKNEGHPGAMLSLSANGDKDGVLWAAIHASGDSWHESRPGVLHAYAADDINRELWNSLENPARDDCNNFSKMAPPTIANGRVYLASFGTENIGTGQLCIYGLLPSGTAPDAPSHVEAKMTGRFVTVSWQPVAGALSYSIESRHGSERHVAATGLRRPVYIGAAMETGETNYRIRALNANGASPPSSEAAITIEKAPQPRMAMH